ncbi:MAG: hypothetical protein KDA51_16080 [Planctomycetales bacterium]|nr:hypothetical protein [Planctomycetales bacterium]
MTWKNVETRLDAIERLALSGSAEAVLPLIRNSNNEPKYIVEPAELAVLRIGSNSVRPLIAMLESPEEIRGNRHRAIRLLGELGAVESVRPMLIANDRGLFTHVVENALNQLGARATEELLKFALDAEQVEESRRIAIDKVGEKGVERSPNTLPESRLPST